jgi:glycosyltransferase involved in cell wall biosynthesis
MKILQVIDRLNVGGAERVLVDLSNVLYEKGHMVAVLTLLCPGPLTKQLNPAIKVINLDRQVKFSLPKLKQANTICRNFDVVHAHLRHNFRYLALAKLLFGGRFKLILHDHFGDIENDQSIPRGIKFFARRNQWFIGVSQPLTKWAINKLGLSPEKVLLLPNVVVKRDGLEKKPTAPSEPTVRILHVSNFREAKNHIFAIKLIAELQKHIPLHVLFVGQVIDPYFFKGIEEAIYAHGIQENATVSHECDDVQSLMQDFDLGMHTAHQESGPLILIEYLAQRLPFIAYKTGEVSTQISSVFPEFFMTDFDVGNWSAKIRDILAKRLEYVQKMDGVFERMYSVDEYYERCKRFYDRIMLEHGAR